jgi:tetratricopeptide (TPR) repeat protein
VPLSEYIEDRVAQLRAFIADPQALVLHVDARPELHLTAAKLLGAAGNGEDGEPCFFVGFSTNFTSAEQFCRELHETVAAEVAIALEALDGEQLAFRLPEKPSEERAIPIEVRLVEYLEGVARAMHLHMRRLVIVLDVDTVHDAAWAETFAALLANTGSGLLAWVVFEHAGEKLGPIAYHRHRTARRRPDEELEHLLVHPGARMLTFIHAPSTPSPATVVRRLHERTRTSSRVWVTLEIPPLPFLQPLEYYVHASRRLAKQLSGSPHVAPLVAEIEELAAYPEPELGFAEFVHRLAVAALRADVGLVLVLHPCQAFPDQYTASLHRLAQAAVSTRVKFVTFDPYRLQPATPELRNAHEFAFDLGAERMEKGIEKKLAQPDLPVRERFQLMLTLANIRLGQERYEDAMQLDLQCLDLAEQTNDPSDRALAWYQLGNAHYHLAFLEDAEQAYAEATHRALETDQLGLAAMALTGAGHSLYCRGMGSEALQAYEAAIALFSKLRLLQHEVFARTWHAQTFVVAKRYAEARDAFEAALKRCETIDPAYASTLVGSRAEILQRLAHLYSLAGRPDLERKYNKDAQDLGAEHPPCMHP